MVNLRSKYYYLMELNPDEIIDGLTPASLKKDLINGVHIKESVISTLFRRLMNLLIEEPNVLHLESPITVCGDIHGQILDLFKLFDQSGENFDEDQNLRNSYLFLGDYVDRGYCSIETFAFLALLKIKYPQKMHIIRGNHEYRQINQIYGLFNDCITLYGHPGTWFLINDVFDYLPIAAIVDKKIFCVHGGLSPKINYIGQISALDRTKDNEGSPIVDLTWSDPDSVKHFTPNSRGNGFLFGPKQTLSFLYNNRLVSPSYSFDGRKSEDPRHGFIARSHQLANNGYQWMHNDNLVIVWSAPNYMYKSGNLASVMKVTKDRAPDFIVYKEDERSSLKPEDQIISYFA
ncbi:Serine/threonine-protein phosphatase 6 catalytic subunit [Tritrichomonas foetus]|uniref:Serine/threonine-protein phosphatase n=1 Tax=Tritrichomonas foetus TaxID=1144522 RepID=A0A1J4KJT3_9EUKA|nr:Serine/threonine-protein phosphatase 6 catalytic subunit [Tritrichomonas foetus]|eukprot:OHT11208.1 Serine/threonine-protein phosphatase 6 catalytic subunit [Tritrichomonas foetus]